MKNKMKLFASIEIPQSIIAHCLNNNVPRLDIPRIFEEYVMSLAGFAYYDNTESTAMFIMWCNEENIFDGYNDDGPEYDSAGFTCDDRIIQGQYMIIDKAVRELMTPTTDLTDPTDDFVIPEPAKPTYDELMKLIDEHNQRSRKRKNNSFVSYIKALMDYGPMSENELNEVAFNYYRNSSRDSNKKYADMLRRALHKGYIQRRLKKANERGQHTYVYYL